MALEMKAPFAAALLLALSGCQSGDSTATASPPGELASDAGQDRDPNARSDAAIDGAKDAAIDATMDSGIPPLRTVTTRPLYATSPDSLLVDPFSTAYDSWGHFVVFVPEAPQRAVAMLRSFVGASPAGVTAPVATWPTLAEASPGASSMLIVAPFSGASGSVRASIWLSSSEEGGTPSGVAVSLLPNERPSVSYPLDVDAEASVSLGGRAWKRLALVAPVAVPQGGWFAIEVRDAGVSVAVQAPEIAPLTAPPPSQALSHVAPRTAGQRAAIGAYAAIVQERSTARVPAMPRLDRLVTDR